PRRTPREALLHGSTADLLAAVYQAANECDFPNVGAVYDRPHFGGLQTSQLWAVIDRPYIGEIAHSMITQTVSGTLQTVASGLRFPFPVLQSGLAAPVEVQTP